MYRFKTYLWSTILILFLSGELFGQIFLPPHGTPQQSNLRAYYPFDVNTPIGHGGMTSSQWSQFKKEGSQISLNGWSDITPGAGGISAGNDGVRGNSFYSDGSQSSAAAFFNGFYQNNPINDIIKGTNSFTISFWYKLEVDSSSPYSSRSLIGRRDACADTSNNGNNTFFDIRGSKPTSSTQGSILAEIEKHVPRYPILSNTTRTSIDAPSCNEWVNCVVTRSLPDSNSFSTTRLYIDGVLKNSNFSQVLEIGIGQSGVFKIGGSPCIGVDGTKRFRGSFDELMIYDLDLTGSEVTMLYNAYASNLNVSVDVSEANICPGNPTILTANVSGGSGYSYLWHPGGQTTQSITVSPVLSTHYTVTVSNSGCEVSVPAVVTVLPAPILDPTFTVTDIKCKGYGAYTVTLSGTGPGSHNWQVYSGNDMTTPAGNEITSVGIYDSPQFNVTIDIQGKGNDNFVIKHGVYDQCVPWSEKKELIKLPCYNPLDAGFNLTYSCKGNSPEIKVSGLSNPCNTEWRFDLFDGTTIIDTIAWFNNNSEAYNMDEYVFDVALDPCKEYVVRYGVWNDCSKWKETRQSVLTTDCPELVADFQFENAQGDATNIFYTCNTSGIFFNGTASENEDQYYIDIWKYNTITNHYDALANKGITGWTSGEAATFDLVSEFSPQGVNFSPGTYKVKLAVANNCNGWFPIEKTFIIEESIGDPVVSFSTHNSATLGTPIKTTFTLGEPIWIKSQMSGASPNNLTNYRFELVYFYNGSVSTQPYAISPNMTGPINNRDAFNNLIPVNLLSLLNRGSLQHLEYRLTCFAYNECGEEVRFSQDFNVIKPLPVIGTGNLEKDNNVYNRDLFSIFPNPVEDNLHVETMNEIDHIEIYSISGGLISTHKSTTVNVYDLPHGIYIARVFGLDGYFENIKFVKE